MPMFHFHVDEEPKSLRGSVELENLQQAQLVAVRFAGEHLRDNSRAVWDRGDCSVAVFNDDGLHMFSVTAFVTIAASAPRA